MYLIFVGNVAIEYRSSRKRSLIVAAHPLKVVRVMNGTGDNLSRCPTETGGTPCTPHLVASLNLPDTNAALGARLGFGNNRRRRCYIVWMTGVSGVLTGALKFVAILTGVLVTHATLPRRAKKAAAIFCGAGANKRHAVNNGRGISIDADASKTLNCVP